MKPATFLVLAALMSCIATCSCDSQKRPKSGIALIYEIDDADDHDADALVDVLKRRVDIMGFKNVIVRRHGRKQVEIITPKLTDAKLAHLKSALLRVGMLRFQILANQTDHEDVIASAKEQLGVERWVVDDDKNRIGIWADVACADKKRGGGLKVDVSRAVLRDPKAKKIVAPPAEVNDKDKLTKWLKDNGFVDNLNRPNIQVLMWAGDGYDVCGDHLSIATKAPDETGNPSIMFTMTKKGARLMGGLTGDNLPDDTGHTRRCGILLDNELLSAPNIRGHITANGEITGNFTDEEVEFLANILRVGRLPAVLKPEPVSETRFGPGEKHGKDDANN